MVDDQLRNYSGVFIKEKSSLYLFKRMMILLKDAKFFLIDQGDRYVRT